MHIWNKDYRFVIEAQASLLVLISNHFSLSILTYSVLSQSFFIEFFYALRDLNASKIYLDWCQL